jgi:hypothetical protein
MAAKIFINYRRDDSAGHAGRVQDRLKSEFAHDLLFLDVDAIPLGVNFVKEIQKAIADCGVLLALIGSDWLEARDTASQRAAPARASVIVTRRGTSTRATPATWRGNRPAPFCSTLTDILT